MKAYHDKKLQRQDFQPGQQVFLFNFRLRLFPGKLKSKWSGPFVIKDNEIKMKANKTRNELKVSNSETYRLKNKE